MWGIRFEICNTVLVSYRWRRQSNLMGQFKRSYSFCAGIILMNSEVVTNLIPHSCNETIEFGSENGTTKELCWSTCFALIWRCDTNDEDWGQRSNMLFFCVRKSHSSFKTCDPWSWRFLSRLVDLLLFAPQVQMTVSNNFLDLPYKQQAIQRAGMTIFQAEWIKWDDVTSSGCSNMISSLHFGSLIFLTVLCNASFK